MNNICSFFSRLSHLSILRRAAVILVTLAWSSLAFCGEIHDAAKVGDLEKVKALIKDDPDLVNSKDNEDATPLLWAAQIGSTNVVDLLLNHGADVNAKGKNGATSLELAAGKGSKDVVELLLTHRADVNAKAPKSLSE